MPNLMFRNDGGRRFVDVTAATGTGHLQKGHGVAFADLDNDGDQDVFANVGGSCRATSTRTCCSRTPATATTGRCGWWA